MTYLGISVEKQEALKERMRRIHVSERDIRESFIRSSGPGGQNVNKVATCVFLEHIPTGIQVKYQRERSQPLNRYYARCLLLEKLETQQKEIQRKYIQAVQKERRKNRKKPAFLKETILRQKHQRSEKKQVRRKLRGYKLEEY